jgi:hypothetical protein
MAVNNLQRNVAYGFSQPLIVVGAEPIISQRAPGANDKAPFGTIWIDQPNNDGYVITSIVNNAATWIGIGGGAGSFTDINVTGTITAGGTIETTTGDIVADAGNITATLGNVSGAGLIATTNNIVAVANDIRAILGDIFTDPGAGDIISGNNITAAQDITATAGDITATAGDIVADAGTIEAVLGSVAGASVYATGDLGGAASTTGFTNAVDTTQGAGTLSILSSSANPGNNAGFLKIYVGATTAYVPYFTTIAP